ncbi:YopX family protein [Enterococcus durans]|uniref:YopX family protein n=1 Tax=Enterococcus durans TaxID=53345 RepID=UPI001D0BB402|nr:YopX family protein [Enterococcus durans]MCB8505398.1 YopX family protein [Enterococcus durans]MCB8514832.1 YopX family protein [Enterococcus durans]
MIPKFRAWVKPDILSNHLNGVIAEAKPDFLGKNCLVRRNDLKGEKCFTEILAFDDIELMQSTGLKDKNGIEIFEGDLVEHDDNINGVWETFEACEIVYDEGYAQFCFKWDAGNFLTDYRNLNVIGNIYENSELLEEQR